jgi:phage shock protein PspC (stress-responsive transcriptional regulator)
MTTIYDGYYKSSDDKQLAGVCGGLAHKLNLNAGGLRLIFVVLGFFWIGLFVYICLWMVLKSAPTRGINPPN